jgi:hypothetical protein
MQHLPHKTRTKGNIHVTTGACVDDRAQPKCFCNVFQELWFFDPSLPNLRQWHILHQCASSLLCFAFFGSSFNAFRPPLNFLHHTDTSFRLQSFWPQTLTDSRSDSVLLLQRSDHVADLKLKLIFNHTDKFVLLYNWIDWMDWFGSG